MFKFFFLLITLGSSLVVYGQSSTLYFGEFIGDRSVDCVGGKVVELGSYKLKDMVFYSPEGKSIAAPVLYNFQAGEYVAKVYMRGGIKGITIKDEICVGIGDASSTGRILTCLNTRRNLGNALYFAGNLCNSVSFCYVPTISSAVQRKTIRIGYIGEDIGDGNKVNTRKFSTGVLSTSMCVKKVN